MEALSRKAVEAFDRKQRAMILAAVENADERDILGALENIKEATRDEWLSILREFNDVPVFRTTPASHEVAFRSMR